MVHLVSTRAGEDGIALGQVVAEAKSNEITAIPELLRQIDLSNAIITIDAMGCQKEIAVQIVAGGGDYVIAVKDNQPKLAEAIETFFREAVERDLEDFQYRHLETRDAGHGRSDIRSYYLAEVPGDFALKGQWPSVKAFGYALRKTRHDDGRTSVEVRYLSGSRYLNGRRYGEAARQHWSIESMPRVLDVNFREDDSRTRERTFGNNLSRL